MRLPLSRNWRKRMRADRQRLLAVLADPTRLLHMHVADQDKALRQLRRLKLLARVAIGLQERQLLEGFSAVVRDQLASAVRMTEARTRLALWELDRLARVLRPGRELPVIVLKGCGYLLLDLPFAASRLLADVDLLVPENRLQEVEVALREAGWESAPLKEYDEYYYRHWAHEIPPLCHVEREIEVDIHHNIVMRTSRLKPRAALLLQDARPAGRQGFAVLAPPDMVLHAMTHLFFNNELDQALRELVDIDSLLRCFAAQDPQFWPRMQERAHQLDLVRPAWYALHYCARWLDTPVPDAVSRGLGAAPVSRLLMDWLLPGALFARDPDRPERAAGVARTLLLARSHWVRMPPWHLLAHLSRKLLRRATNRGRVAP